MKVIRILSGSDVDVPSLTLHADSSLLTPGHPLFIPEEDAQWVGVPHLAIHICRLGKNIAPKFASRYYDRFTLSLHITTADASSTDPRINALRDLGDFSIVIGDWVETLPDQLEINGTALDPSAARALVDPLIASISRLTTFKTGDIILLPLGSGLPLQRWMNAPGLLNVKVI